MNFTRTARVNSFAAICAALSIGCSGRVAYDAATGGSPSIIINSMPSGGFPSITIGPGSSGGSASTGGGTSIHDRCNGLFIGKFFRVFSVVADVTADAGVAQFCDIPMSFTPVNTVDQIETLIDCQPIPSIPGDDITAENVDGFGIDYSQNPAHLVLRGTSCAALQVTGVHTIDVIEGYPRGIN